MVRTMLNNGVNCRDTRPRDGEGNLQPSSEQSEKAQRLGRKSVRSKLMRAEVRRVSLRRRNSLIPGVIQGCCVQQRQGTCDPLRTLETVYENVVIHQDTRVPWGDTTQNVVFDSILKTTGPAPTALGTPATGTTSVGRAIFVGAQAAAFACGPEEGPEGQPLKLRWVEELLDGNNQLRITSGMIYGIKKTRFNSSDYATIVCSTWNAP